jgi:PmbA protein
MNYLEQAIDALKKEGASQVQATHTKASGFSMTIRHRVLDQSVHHQQATLSLVGFWGYRRVSVCLNEWSCLDHVAKKMHTMANVLPDDTYVSLPDSTDQSCPALSLDHPWALSPENARLLAEQCEASGRAYDHRITNSEGASVQSVRTTVYHANSNGFAQHYTKTMHAMQCVLVAGTECLKRDWEDTAALSANHLMLPEHIGISAAKKAIARLNNQPFTTQTLPVLLMPDVAMTLVHNFLEALAGHRIANHTSYLTHQLHQNIGPSYLSIVEYPFLEHAIHSCPFDAEGVYKQTNYWLNAGHVQSFALNTYYAKRLGLKSTGNAGGTSNVVVESPVKTMQEILSSMTKGVIIQELLGDGFDPITGDYSYGATGFYVENGHIMYPIEDITFSGHLSDTFKRFVCMADDIITHRACHTGSWLLDDTTIAGL